MGLLNEGQVLTWEEGYEYIDLLKIKGINQFIRLYRETKSRKFNIKYFGYETEFMILKNSPNYEVSLIAPDIIKKLNSLENTSNWKPEYSNWIIEKIPDKPLPIIHKNILLIESAYENDRKTIQNQLLDDSVLYLSSFPLLGREVVKNLELKNSYSKSKTISDNCINPHIRFKTLTRNIRKRRGKKVDIVVPIFQDKYTKLNNISMDCMAFGMGCCCNQLTIQLDNIDNCRYIYDQLAILSPIILALSASTPLLNGYLANTDTRWKVISQSVDDRTEYDKQIIKKSRFSSIDMYLSKHGESYNDIKIFYNETFYE